MEKNQFLFLTIFTLTVFALITILYFPGAEDIEGEGIFYSGDEKLAEVKLEIADTPEKRKKGLMNRTFLPENHGMLFSYPVERERSFWMKNTYVPLDIIYIDSNNTIADIKKAYPEPEKPDEKLKIYRGGPAKFVLEVKQNFTDTKSIEIGDKFSFNRTKE